MPRRAAPSRSFDAVSCCGIQMAMRCSVAATIRVSSDSTPTQVRKKFITESQRVLRCCCFVACSFLNALFDVQLVQLYYIKYANETWAFLACEFRIAA